MVNSVLCTIRNSVKTCFELHPMNIACWVRVVSFQELMHILRPSLKAVIDIKICTQNTLCAHGAPEKLPMPSHTLHVYRESMYRVCFFYIEWTTFDICFPLLNCLFTELFAGYHSAHIPWRFPPPVMRKANSHDATPYCAERGDPGVRETREDWDVETTTHSVFILPS